MTGSCYGTGAKAGAKEAAKPGAEGGGEKPNVFQADRRTHFGVVERLIEEESVLLHHVLAIVPKVTTVLI